MRFISTVLWAIAAVLVALFAYRNWGDVTLNLWSDLQADVKIPVLLLAFFLLGFLPTWLLMRARLWSATRRVEALERTRASMAAQPGEQQQQQQPGEPVE